MFISHKKGLKLDGKNPTLLYGYGGFNISLTPGLHRRPTWSGWRWAASTPCANLRGGGEYGEDWHQAGTKLQQAERLRRLHRRRRVADREQVHLARRSWRSAAARNGGLLVGACMTQRPDLFGAALPARRRDGHAPLPQVHHRLGLDRRLRLVRRRRASSRRCSPTRPLHNLKPGTCYPPTLITTADHDDRVVPGAQLQVRRRAPGGPGGRQPGPDPHRDQGRPRRRQADRQDHRGSRRPLGLLAAPDGPGRGSGRRG